MQTSRLVLRQWRAADREPFAALNADPAVMEHFPALLLRAESDALAGRIEAHFAEHGFGLWAVEIPGVATFAGFVGLSIPSFHAHFTLASKSGGGSRGPTGVRGTPRKAGGRRCALDLNGCAWRRSCRSPCPPTCRRAV